MFEPLKDPAYFNQVYVDHGAVAWPGQIYLAPDAMIEGDQSQRGVGIGVADESRP